MCGMSQQHPDRSTATRPARPDASMSLLTNVMEHSLDEGYAEAAARRKADGGGAGLPRTLRAKLWLGAGLVLAALVVTLGAAQARYEAPTAAKERQELIARVEDGTAEADGLQERVHELRETVAGMQREALRDHGGSTGELVQLLAGATPVEGPGVELSVDDAEDTGGEPGGPRQTTGFADTGRVRDRDLQLVVNGLWAAGAEAVSINGQRLTSLSAIRAAGDAILVDNKPLVPPYKILAVGDGQEFADRFSRSVDGQYLKVLEEDYGIRADLDVRDGLRLPAAPSLTLRTAEPVTTGKGSNS
ncbi:DUF881 domain-containing protein [Streptomyces sp. TRM 70351]|uniref:DUF881 domain-containing protein n=1 Tax=Streptomyces sp. TRM 70351 TaxID=3116552 RepID=UPI002E7B7DE0|nr:DUF881 domain-containing protein [Streptomyces sp. TRM 70351]MEE1931356.1 DUF881 domain-containing protein [Streptomyces sp. TRM 70351]